MSKCNMNKFKPGGRCGGDSGACAKENPSGVSSSYSALLAARDAQDRSFATPALKQMFEAAQPQQQAIILAKKPVVDKQKIMDMILQGDMSD
jgi:hypothetical protein